MALYVTVCRIMKVSSQSAYRTKFSVLYGQNHKTICIVCLILVRFVPIQYVYRRGITVPILEPKIDFCVFYSFQLSFSLMRVMTLSL